MSKRFTFFGGIDFSGAREPLANLWTAIGVEDAGRLCILSIRPHAFRADLAVYVRNGWKAKAGAVEERILWGADFPFGLPEPVRQMIGTEAKWASLVSWVADRPADEVRAAAGEVARLPRGTDTAGALAPLDIRLYKQTVEGFRWLQEISEDGGVSIIPQARLDHAPVTLIEVYPSGAAQELGMPRRRAPSRPGEIKARAASLKPFMDFADAECESLAVTLEDAWDATVACLTAYLCRDDLEQPTRLGTIPRSTIEIEGWIYRPPITLS